MTGDAPWVEPRLFPALSGRMSRVKQLGSEIELKSNAWVLRYGWRATNHREHGESQAEWKYPRRLVFRCVPVRLFVLLSYGSFDSSGGSETLGGACCCGRQ